MKLYVDPAYNCWSTDGNVLLLPMVAAGEGRKGDSFVPSKWGENEVETRGTMMRIKKKIGMRGLLIRVA